MSLQNARQRNIETKRLIADGISLKDDKKKTQADKKNQITYHAMLA
ncbi:hypothetical protein M917_0694 [Psychrobacter aquaticus CMS 56]|uniref:Uncharacterized protein n=1 Tax=Psychrobacter aquaticus CMS 56 TaxID=1354303 RepID=U4T8F2_9GAMM|nr:hypothetical protein M917_0694 [Psychrobacter aquaticus CMS 56]